jgi:hypothetical protein
VFEQFFSQGVDGMLGYICKPAEGKYEGDHGDEGHHKGGHSNTEETLLVFACADDLNRLPEEDGDEKETGDADKKEENDKDEARVPHHKVQEEAFQDP